MHISSVTIKNYKSFLDRDIEFVPGINLIVGINNSGKSALLECLSMTIGDFPHDGPKGDGEPSAVLPTISFSSKEAGEVFAKPMILPGFAINKERVQTRSICRRFVTKGLALQLRATARKKHDNYCDYISGDTRYQKSGELYQVVLRKEDLTVLKESAVGSGFVGTFEEMARGFVDRIFYFSGERARLGSSPFKGGKNLLPDASNLADVLYKHATANSRRFHEMFVERVRRVLPNIEDISFDQDPSSHEVEIFIWPKQQPVAGREIRYPLKNCGSGIGQVLAMLFVIEYLGASAIVIDEINSFLHPAATIEMLRIFKENDQHQYFVSTHSPEVFLAVRPEKYISLRIEEYETEVEQQPFGYLGETYRELGISPFYTFTYWVEGPTECLALPYLLDDSSLRFFSLNVSDVISRKTSRQEINRLLEIYENALAGTSGDPLKIEMTIAVDREHLNLRDKEEYERRPDKIVNFLPREMFENYILHPRAVAAILSEESGSEIAPEDVSEIFAAEQGSIKLAKWLVETKGAKVLERCFSDLTEKKCEFIKTSHVPRIVQWIVKKDPDFLNELKEFFESLKTRN